MGERRSHVASASTVDVSADPPSIHYDDEELPARALTGRVALQNARKTDPIPLHRGAAKALDDLGAPRLTVPRTFRTTP
ncbi:hypothetical protein HH310_19255 [Actinoplanes sp. TBRC 11911]|uniref:hypothetical protein n=1 Tax=Actinoplanes sp. TBRC 11911 TaxID=2729386 RepID=UPI00145F2BC7|nr:hypothetical protein [Actinoplanes sp. TBRC 11911]NMO53322.1 hypothetical protein [Actinoplanes sp. TBRC 11911]